MEAISFLSEGERNALSALKKELQARYKLVQLRALKQPALEGEEPGLDVFIVLEECDWEVEQDLYKFCFELEVKNEISMSPIVYALDELDNVPFEQMSYYKSFAQEGLAV